MKPHASPHRSGNSRCWIEGSSFAFWLFPAVLAILTFISSLQNEYVYDDPRVIATEAKLARLPVLELLASLRGLLYLTLRWDRLLWSQWPPGAHLTSVLTHGVATALAAILVYVLWGRRRLALITGLLFAVHPVHTEAIVSIANRKDLLAMIFVVLTIIIWMKCRGWIRYLGVLASFALAMVSKEVAAAGLLPLLPVLALLPGFHNRSAHSPRTLMLGGTILIGACLVLGIMNYHHLENLFSPSSIIKITEGSCRNYGEVLSTILAHVPGSVRLLIFPVQLHADYGIAPQDIAGAAVLGGLLLILWFGAIVILSQRHLPALFGCLWIVIMAAPASNIVPLTRFFLADRYLYVPSWGACFLIALLLDGSIRRVSSRPNQGLRVAPSIIIVALVVVAAGRSIVRIHDWRDEITLWSADLRTTHPGSFRQYHNLGAALAQAGRFKEAIVRLESALRLWPDIASARYDLGLALFMAGDFDRSTRELERCVALTPTDARAHLYLGLSQLKCDRREEALRQFLRVLELDPTHLAAALNAATLQADCNRRMEAIRLMSNVLKRCPDLPEAYLIRGGVLARAGERDLAIADYYRALRLQPTYRPALVALSWAYSTSPTPAGDARVREAVKLAELACANSHNGDPRALRALAAGQAAQGDFDNALDTIEKSRRAALSVGQFRFAASLDTIEYSFRRHKAYVERQATLSLLDEVAFWSMNQN